MAPRSVFDASTRDLVLSAAAELGQGEEPAIPRAHFDAIVMTGGMVRAGLVKPRFVAELFQGGVSADHVVFLGGFRPFAGDELLLAHALDVAGSNETDGMIAGMVKTFTLLDVPEVAGESNSQFGGNASWQEWSWQQPGMRFSVVAAASSEPQRRRAHTADTFRFWSTHLKPPKVTTILLVTTPIYVPYQAAVGVEVFGLEYDLAVRTVGASVASNDLGIHTQLFEPQHHLQELRSAITALARLRRTLMKN